MGLALSPQVFAITARLIEERAGLHYEAANMDLVADKLSQRAAELGLESLLDYYYYLRYDPAGCRELSMLIEALVVQETYFFREMDSLEVLVRSVVPELLRTRQKVRIWSAACATGEEPYTLAMLLEGAGLSDRAEIVASDISQKGLARAREGTFAGRSLRAIERSPLAGGLVAVGPGKVRVDDGLRRKITWHCVNLLDRDEVATLGSFDVVLCRNVLIYFADTTVSEVARNIECVLRRDGWLLVGASESLLRFGTLFVCEERGGAYFYRKSPE